MKAVALLHPKVSTKDIDPFRTAHYCLEPREDLEIGDPLDAALILGGDGTVHRYLPDLKRKSIPALVVPKGSGNDFSKALGISNEAAALKAWRHFCVSGGENIKTIDLGVIRSEKDAYLFCCVAGMGLDSLANARANRMPAWLRGSAGYLVAAMASVADFEITEFIVSTEAEEITGPGFLLAVGNAHRYGHGIKIAPRAQLSDGLLDICFVGRMNRLKLLCCLPTVFFGAHLGIKQVEYRQARSLRIESGRPLEVYADGEFVCHTPVEISVLRDALKVIVP